MGASFVLLLLPGDWDDALFGLTAAGDAAIGVVPGAARDADVQQIATSDVVSDDVLVLRP